MNKTVKTLYLQGQPLREIFIVTEWKGNTVYKTKTLGLCFCNADLFSHRKDIQVVSPSNKITQKYLTLN